MKYSLTPYLVVACVAAFLSCTGGGTTSEGTASEPGAALEAAPEPASEFATYAGRYAVDRLTVLEVEAHGERVSIVPPFWTSKPYFGSEDGRIFLMELPSPRPHRQATFGDLVGGVPGSLTLTEVDRDFDGRTFSRLSSDERTAVDLFLARDPGAAAALALEAAAEDDELASFALNVILSYRSRLDDAAVLLERLVEARPEHARLRSLYGHALVAAGRRDEALKTFEVAQALDPEDETVPEGLRRLRFEEPPPGEGYRAVLPFTLAAALAPPTEAEIAAVRRDWASRDLSAKNVQWVGPRVAVELDHARLRGQVLRHDVHGDAHYGVVFVPEGAEPGTLPAVVDVRGVNPTYSPLDASASTKTQRALVAAQGDFVFLVPGLRGNTLIFDGTEYVSGGDPSDAWDGATDDTLAFLDAALEVIPEIDPERVAIVGYSRGGTVALLAGIRDPRIDLVLDVVGPVDHIAAMDSSLGWTTAEQVADALRDGNIPEVTEEGGQDFDHWFDRVGDPRSGGETLAGVRRRLIASSPLYFLEDLPETHAYYGTEDRSVPLVNAHLLRDRLAELGRLGRDASVRIFELRGHDTDPLLVQEDTAKRLMDWARGAGSL